METSHFLELFGKIIPTVDLSEDEVKQINDLMNEKHLIDYDLSPFSEQLYRFAKVIKWIEGQRWPSGTLQNKMKTDLITMNRLLKEIKHKKPIAVEITTGTNVYKFEHPYWCEQIRQALLKDLGDFAEADDLGGQKMTLPESEGKKVTDEKSKHIRIAVNEMITMLHGEVMKRNDKYYLIGKIKAQMTVYDTPKQKESNLKRERRYFINNIASYL